MYKPVNINPKLSEHSIKLTIEGEPIGKGRPRVTSKGHFAHAYTPSKTKNYEKLIQNSYLSNYTYDNMLIGPIKANLVAYFSIPNSVSKRKQKVLLNNLEKHTKKPDIDNVVKSVFDALNNLAFEDDSNIVEVSAKKMYSNNPRVELELKEVKYEVEKKEYKEWIYRFFNEPLNTYNSVMKYFKDNKIFGIEPSDSVKVK